MTAEQISDALAYLDDDLIAAADEVRRGVRVLYRPPVGGLIAAACAALVLVGAHTMPRAMHDAAENGEAVQDHYGYSSGRLDMESSVAMTGADWQTVAVGGVTVTIPPDWEWAKLDVNEQWQPHLALSHGKHHLVIGYYPNFASCGTGLEQKQITLAGMEAWVGTYDGRAMWDFIRLPGDFVVINESGEEWTEEERTDIIAILQSMELKEVTQ